MLEITLTWVSGYHRSHRGRDDAPFIRSITHAPDQTYIRLQQLHCLFDLAISPPFWIIAWIETIFMEFRGPKALVNLHGCRQVFRIGVLAEDKKEFAERQRKAIADALAECHGRVSGPHGAAAKLGIPHQTLASKIESLGIDKRQFKVNPSKQASA